MLNVPLLFTQCYSSSFVSETSLELGAKNDSVVLSCSLPTKRSREYLAVRSEYLTGTVVGWVTRSFAFYWAFSRQDPSLCPICRWSHRSKGR
jgi:hypothetical protein